MNWTIWFLKNSRTFNFILFKIFSLTRSVWSAVNHYLGKNEVCKHKTGIVKEIYNIFNHIISYFLFIFKNAYIIHTSANCRRSWKKMKVQVSFFIQCWNFVFENNTILYGIRKNVILNYYYFWMFRNLNTSSLSL